MIAPQIRQIPAKKAAKIHNIIYNQNIQQRNHYFRRSFIKEWKKNKYIY